MPVRKVLTAYFMHETHSFSPIPADLNRFKRTNFHVGDEVPANFRGTRTELGAVFDLADQLGWTLAHPIAAHTTPSGPVTAEAFDIVLGHIVAGLEQAMPVDGIFMVLHGAMVAEGIADAEGEILRRIRAVAGPDVPLAVTLDAHANVGPALAQHANIVSTFRTTPHVDMYETAMRAGMLLDRAMKGEISPRVAYAQRPLFFGLDMGRTIQGHGPMVDILAKAQAHLAENPAILDISINAGFDWSDKENIGPAILVTHHDASAAAEAIASELIDFAWETRHIKTVTLHPLDEVIRMAAEPATGPGPLLIGDYTDCPGGGAAGDGTTLLAALLASDLKDVAYASIADPAAVQIALAAGLGADIEVSLGGKIDPSFGGLPIAVRGRVTAISEGNVIRRGPYQTGKLTSYGPSCVIKCGEVRIIVATERMQIEDREHFRIFGIQPETTNILVCKAVNHFRADFEPIGRRLIYAESGGAMSNNFAQFPYRNIRRPIWPLDGG